MADTEVTHKLEMAGCKSVKAAKALLEDFECDKTAPNHLLIYQEIASILEDAVSISVPIKIFCSTQAAVQDIAISMRQSP